MTGTFSIDDESGLIELHVTVDKRMNKQQVEELTSKFENYEYKVIQHRRLSADQHRLIWALYGTLEDYTGQNKEDWHQLLMGQFEIMNDLQGLSTSFRSANALTVQQAADYIEYILFFGLENGYPLYVLEGPRDDRKIKRTYQLCRDIRRYQVLCIMKKICAVCGKVHDDTKETDQVTIHHIEHANRAGGYKYDEGQLKVISMCGPCHAKIHDIAGEEFEKYLDQQYHLDGVRLSGHELLLIAVKDLYPSHFMKYKQDHKETINQAKELLNGGLIR